MSKLGSSKRPAIVRVQTVAKAEEMMFICEQNDWQVIVGIEPDEKEDISDVTGLLNPSEPAKAGLTVSRNAPCPCGSGRKFKNVAFQM